MSFCLIISVQKHVMAHDVCLNGEGCLTARAVTYGVFTGGWSGGGHLAEHRDVVHVGQRETDTRLTPVPSV